MQCCVLQSNMSIQASVFCNTRQNYRPFQMRTWSCITSYPLRGLPYLAYNNVNPAVVNSMMLHSSMYDLKRSILFLTQNFTYSPYCQSRPYIVETFSCFCPATGYQSCGNPYRRASYTDKRRMHTAKGTKILAERRTESKVIDWNHHPLRYTGWSTCVWLEITNDYQWNKVFQKFIKNITKFCYVLTMNLKSRLRI